MQANGVTPPANGALPPGRVRRSPHAADGEIEAALKAQSRTVGELVELTHTSEGMVRGALDRLGAKVVDVREREGNSFGKPIRVYGLKKPGKRTKARAKPGKGKAKGVRAATIEAVQKAGADGPLLYAKLAKKAGVTTRTVAHALRAIGEENIIRTRVGRKVLIHIPASKREAGAERVQAFLAKPGKTAVRDLALELLTLSKEQADLELQLGRVEARLENIELRKEQIVRQLGG